MRIVVLGSTGSIGVQTLDVIRRLGDPFSVVGISAFQNQDLLTKQAAEFGVRPRNAVCGTGPLLVDLATLPEADLVVVSVAGAAGMLATLAALKAGKEVALATKEVLVAAGSLVTKAARNANKTIRPIDSEHSAVFQCLQGSRRQDLAKIWLTASGGPFRTWPAERLAAATLDDALNHPTWPTMGRKITVDSATLMNKGLEVIEAQWLFDVPLDRVEVVVHPQSMVHSIVEMNDGSLLAQMGAPDMRVPIQYALTYPKRMDTGLKRVSPLDLGTLTFEAPDIQRFPALALARWAGNAGGTFPAVMNAANETAVSLFLQRRIGFAGITQQVEHALEHHSGTQDPDLDAILAADQEARDRVTLACTAL